MNKEIIIENLRCIPDFPKKGINFRDVTTLYQNAECLKSMTEDIYNLYKDKGITKVVGIESRGFVMASAVAPKLNAGVVLARKPGKLPATVIKESFTKEYGVDTVEMHSLATLKLVKHFKPKAVYINFIIEITDEGLHGRDVFDGLVDVTALVTL